MRYDRRGLRAVGLDHHEAGAVEKLFGIDARLAAGLFTPGRGLLVLLVLHEESRGLDSRGLLLGAWFFVPRRFDMLLLALRLELMDAPLRLDHGRISDLLVLARTIAAVAIAAAPVAPATPVLLAFALGARLRLRLLSRLMATFRELVILGRLAADRWRLSLMRRQLRLRRLLRGPSLLVLPAALLLLAAIRTWTAISAPTVSAMLLAVALSIAPLSVAPLSIAALAISWLTAVAPTFEPALLLPVAAAALIPSFVTAPIAPSTALEAVAAATLLLVAAVIALAPLALPLRLLGRGSGGRSRRLLGKEAHQA